MMSRMFSALKTSSQGIPSPSGSIRSGLPSSIQYASPVSQVSGSSGKPRAVQLSPGANDSARLRNPLICSCGKTVSQGMPFWSASIRSGAPSDAQ